jgi:hypothetical protein
VSIIDFSATPPAIVDTPFTRLPKFQFTDKLLQILQTQWSQILNPIVALPMSSQNTLRNVTLTGGIDITINHYLGRKLQGWMCSRIRASATIFDNQDANTDPENTLILQSDNTVVVDLVVF